MSEPHVEPPAADVRSFLPRSGEPVEDYAARLRALHHDLTLVLEAVERGLAAAEAEELVSPPAEVRSLYPPEAVAEPHRSPPPPVPASVPRGSARVEVVSTPATARGAEATGRERAWSGPQEPEGSAPWGGRRATTGEGAGAWGEPAAPSPERLPWVESLAPAQAGAERSPWVESVASAPRGEGREWVERSPGGDRRGRDWVQPSQGGDPADRVWSGRAAAPHGPPEPPPWTERRPSAWPPPPPPPAEMSFEPPPHAPFAGPPRRRLPSLPPLVLAATLLGWLIALALALALAFHL